MFQRLIQIYPAAKIIITTHIRAESCATPLWSTHLSSHLFDAHHLVKAVKLRYDLDLAGVDTEVESLVLSSIPRSDRRGNNRLEPSTTSGE